jgi:hypothetical protein
MGTVSLYPGSDPMRRSLRILGAMILGLGLWTGSSAAWAMGLAEKAELQAAMQRHVDRQSVDGAYPALDPHTGEVLHLHPVTAHPMILQMGQDFVLCFDFRDGKGQDVPVDFYMTRKDGSFMVFHSAARNREMLHDFMKAGKVTRAN